MQIIDNKALLLKVKEPGRITTVIPRAKVLDSGEVLVKWGLEEAQVLKKPTHQKRALSYRGALRLARHVQAVQTSDQNLRVSNFASACFCF
jgi:hypothetical protein